MELLFAYTREMAITDGILIDVSSTARECGIRYHTALTRSVWTRFVQLPDDHETGMDPDGRLWDILFLLKVSCRQTTGTTVRFWLATYDAVCRAHRVVRLKAICGPGDDWEPVITVMLPEED